jgi:alpha-maltose-1-phosphate synthase
LKINERNGHMRIGIVSFSDTESGMDLANFLIEAGHEVVFYLPYKRAQYLVGEDDDQADQVEKFYRYHLLRRDCQIRIIRFPRIRDPRSLSVAMQLKDKIKSDQLDVVHVMIGPLEFWISVLVLLLRSLPVVVTLVIPKPNVGEAMPSWIETEINHLATLRAQYIIVNGSNLVKDVYDVYHFPVDRVFYVPLAPRFSIYHYLNQPIDKEKATVLFVGRLLPHKGIEYLIEAEPIISKAIPDVRFLIAVHCDQTDYLEKVLNLIGNNPRFEVHNGFMSGEDMAVYYARSTVVALPYLSASTSGVLLDSYSFGKPVVATRVGALPEYVVDGQTGLLIPPTDVELLAQAIIKILSDSDLQEEMSNHARGWIENLKHEIVMKNEEVYKKAMIRFNTKQR